MYFCFMYGIMFFHNGPIGSVVLPQQPPCSDVYGLTPLLHVIDGILC